MRRSRLLLCALALLALTAAPAAAGERAGATARGPASASLDECAPGTAVFEAAMDAVPGASRMSMKFVLQARRGRRFRRVDAAGFGTWTTSEPGVARYVYTRRVESLLPGARYRVKVRFRWHDGAGEKLAQARGRSRACRQPDPRPNLRIDDLFAEGDRHVAVVRNDGREAADTFAVRVGDAEVWLDGLAPGRTRRIEVAAACEPGADVVAEADPGDRVDERSERDNTSTLTCA